MGLWTKKKKKTEPPLARFFGISSNLIGRVAFYVKIVEGLELGLLEADAEGIILVNEQ